MSDANPLTDPSLNVKELVELRARYEAELRQVNEKWQGRFDDQRDRASNERIQAEAGRIDALLAANANNVALALSKQEAQALAQDKRIAVLEQNQYQAGGKDIQRIETRQGSQFTMSQLIAGGGVLVLILIELHRSGVL